MRLLPHVKRRGRPRLQRFDIDQGTEELQRKRRALVQSDKTQDQLFSESLLGVLYARQLISGPLYDAGCFFKKLAWDYQPCLGTVFKRHSHSLFLRYGRQEKEDMRMSEEEERQRIDAWRKALNVLYNAGMHPYRVVLAVTFYERDLHTDSSSVLIEKQELRFLKKGLEHLSLYFTTTFQDTVSKLVGRVLDHFQATIAPQPLKALPPSAPQESETLKHRDP